MLYYTMSMTMTMTNTTTKTIAIIVAITNAITITIIVTIATGVCEINAHLTCCVLALPPSPRISMWAPRQELSARGL